MQQGGRNTAGEKCSRSCTKTKRSAFSVNSVISYCISTQKDATLHYTTLRYACQSAQNAHTQHSTQRCEKRTSLPDIPKQIITPPKPPSPTPSSSSARLRSNRTSMTPPPELLILLHVKPTRIRSLSGGRSCRGRHVAPAAIEGCLHCWRSGFESVRCACCV